MKTDSTDVVVIGAGPAGLTLANYLMMQGVSVRVIDQAPEPPVRESSFLHGPGSETLQRVGALDSLRDETAAVTRSTVHLGQLSIRLRYTDSAVKDSVLPMVVSQTSLERALRERLAELGGAVEWGSGLVDIEQDAVGATVVLGSGERVRARWVVGCDGVESMVRKTAGISFPGTSSRYLLLDAYVDWDLDRDGLTGWLHPEGQVGAMPMIDPGGADNLWRILARDPEPGPEKLSDEEIVSRVRAVLREYTPHGEAELRDTTTKVVFMAHARIADVYRKGQVLLAGDAAHAHVPFGGPAIHTGMEDAENLAWKLALVTQGLASEALVDTYGAERRPIASDILLGTTGSRTLDIINHPVVRVVRDRVAAPLLKVPLIQRLTTYSKSQMWETYRDGPLGGGGRFGSKPRPGDTVPDVDCVRPEDGSSTRLYNGLAGRWVLLTPAGSGPASAAAAARRWLGDDRVVVLERSANGAGTPSGRAGREVWLVRPDAHLAWRGQPGSPDLERWLRGALQHGHVSQ